MSSPGEQTAENTQPQPEPVNEIEHKNKLINEASEKCIFNSRFRIYLSS